MGKYIHRFSTYKEFQEAYNTPVDEVLSFTTANGTFKFFDTDDQTSIWYDENIDKYLFIPSLTPKVGCWDYETQGFPEDAESFVGAVDEDIEWNEENTPPPGYFVEILSVTMGQYTTPWLSAVDEGVPQLTVIDNGVEYTYEYIGQKEIQSPAV